MSTIKSSGENLKLSSDNTKDIELQHNGSTNVTVKSDGNVGIGTNTFEVFNSIAGNSKLVVRAESNSTSIIGNTETNITIVNGDGTADNTAAIHFAREDTDESPNYAGASVVAQFKQAQVTGQYPKTDIAFLTSTDVNLAPSEKMRIDSAGNVGIGYTNPNDNIHILGNSIYPNVGITLQSHDTQLATATLNLMSRDINNVNKTILLTASKGNLSITGDAGAGIVTMPNQPAFGAYATNQSYGVNTLFTADLDQIEFDIGNNFNISTNRFTAPVSGRYLFTGSVQYSSVGAAHVNFRVNGSNVNGGWVDMYDAAGASQSRVFNLNQSDYVEMVMYHSIAGTTTGDRVRMTGYLIG